MITVDIEQIRIDGGTQQRPIDNNVVNEYAEAMAEGTEFPPVRLAWDEKEQTYWLWDGFHRYLAHQKLNREQIEADYYDADLATAISWSYSANKDHGFRRQPGVVKKIILKMLKDPIWENATDAEIAEHVGATRQYVSMVKSGRGESQKATSCHCQQDGSENANKSQTETSDEQSQDEETGNSSEPEKDEPLKDKAGQPIPANLIHIYNNRSVITSLMKKVSDLKSEVLSKIAEKDILFTALNPKQFEADCNNLRRDLKKTEPYAVCPYCGGSMPENCKACKGYGFIDKINYDAAPRELKNEIVRTV